MKVAIIGCGLIGVKRAQALGDNELVACVDIIVERAENLASKFDNCQALTDWQKVMSLSEVDIVVICTQHNTLAKIALAAIEAGKHVLIEKPGARNPEELAPLLPIAKEKNVLVRVGFNHRYHRALRKAQEIIKAGELGEMMFVRARYGHGGRIGYEKEWRADPVLSGGGELIDQGIHLIDLARWFLGDFSSVEGHAQTYYWDMPVDDNSFLILKTPKNQIAFLHASCTEWKNIFSFEIYGKKGKIDINGLGGSYGTERITFYKMTEKMGPPETFIWEYPMEDDSFALEFKTFCEDIKSNRLPSPGITDAIAALKIISDVYRTASA